MSEDNSEDNKLSTMNLGELLERIDSLEKSQLSFSTKIEDALLEFEKRLNALSFRAGQSDGYLCKHIEKLDKEHAFVKNNLGEMQFEWLKTFSFLSVSISGLQARIEKLETEKNA